MDIVIIIGVTAFFVLLVVCIYRSSHNAALMDKIERKIDKLNK